MNLIEDWITLSRNYPAFCLKLAGCLRQVANSCASLQIMKWRYRISGSCFELRRSCCYLDGPRRVYAAALIAGAYLDRMGRIRVSAVFRAE